MYPIVWNSIDDNLVSLGVRKYNAICRQGVLMHGLQTSYCLKKKCYVFLCKVCCYILFPLITGHKSLCCISSRLHLPQHPVSDGGCVEFPLSPRVPAVWGSPGLDVAAGTACCVAADGLSCCGFAGLFLNLLALLAYGAPCDSDCHGLIPLPGEKGWCSVVWKHLPGIFTGGWYF